MPTIDIPDKICLCCGGIRWRIEKYNTLKKGVVTRYRCAKEHAERTKKYYYSHLNEVRQYTSMRISEGINKTPEKRQYYKDRSRKETQDLSDNYVRKMIAHRMRKSNDISLEQKELSSDLISIKRKQLLLTRQIKNNGKNNQDI